MPMLAGGDVGDGQASIGNTPAMGTLPAPPPQQYDQQIIAARGMIQQDPKRVAQVVKTWVGEDG
jgi:flagellar M-ring protein FliF